MQSISRNFERILSIIALIASLFALILSWQANQIQSRMTEPQLVFLSNWTYFEPQSQWFSANKGCRTYINIANLGGATAIVKEYGVNIDFKGETLTALGSGILTTSPPDHAIELLQKSQVHSYIMTSEGYDLAMGEQRQFNTGDVANMPLKIDAYDTAKFVNDIEFSVDPNQYIQSDKQEDGFAPVEVTIVFKTAQSQIITTSRSPCTYFK